MKNSILKITILGISLFSINTFAQEYIYHGIKNVEATIGMNKDKGDLEQEQVSADCYDPANIGKIGTGQGCEGFLIVDNTILRDLVLGNTYTTNDNKIVSSYADNIIFTGQVTDMTNLFNRTDVLFPISNWDVSNVTTLENAFYFSRNFNQDIGSWDVSNVSNFKGTFHYATSFNQPLNNWDVSNATTLENMFVAATSFNQPLNNWNVSNVTNMQSLFNSARSFNQNLSSWNVSNVTNMQSLFRNTDIFNQNINNWCVSNILDKPASFDENSILTLENQPVWGTCP